MCHHPDIYILVGPLSQMNLVLFYKFIIHEFIHFALPKCRLNLDQHEYKLLQLSSSASQCDTWAFHTTNMYLCQYAFHTTNMYLCHPWDEYVGIFEKICTVWKPKVLFGESVAVVDLFHLIVRNCCWGKRDLERPPKTKIFIIMD